MNLKNKMSQLKTGISNLFMAKKKYYTIFFVIFLLVLLTFCYLTKSDSEQIGAQNGILDIESLDFEINVPISLNGQWEFYWKQFMMAPELLNSEPDLLVQIPHAWNEYCLNGKELPGEGYGTYRLHVRTGLLKGDILGLSIQTFSSAYRLYIDDKLIAKNGDIGITASEEVGEYKPQTVYFSAPSNEFDIIIHVSNYNYARGGFWSPMYMGSQNQITKFNDATLIKDMIIIGAFLIVALFYIVSFFLMKENKANLYFGLLCILGIIAFDTSGQLALTKTISGISLNTLIFVWYSSCIWVMMFILLYMNELFESRFSKIVIRVFLVLVSVIQMFYILAPPPIYTSFGRVTNYIEIFCMLSAAIIAIIGVINKKKNSWLNLSSLMILLVTIVYDTLYYTNVIQSSHGGIIYIGLFVFLLIQMLIKAICVKDYYEHKNAAELRFLQAQIKPHFLYNALNAIISISRDDQDRSTNLLVSFSNYLRGCFDFKGTNSQTLLRKEMEHVNAYLEIEKARFEERIEFSIVLPENLEYNIPVLVLQPVIENAIVHGLLPKPEGGKIELIVMEYDSYLEFSVKDNGIGMDDKKILQGKSNVMGNGIALDNIDSRLRKTYGTGLEIVSETMIGTEVRWRIPINERN